MKVFESGNFRVKVPEGWKAFLGTDSSGKQTPNKVHIYKGITFETDIFTNVGITVCFFENEKSYFSPKSFYNNIEDREAFTLGDYTWSCYTCTSLDYPYTMLDGKKNGHIFQVMILMKNGEDEITLDDTDVQLIIGSIAAAKKQM